MNVMHIRFSVILRNPHKSYQGFCLYLGIKTKKFFPSYLYNLWVDNCPPQRYTFDYPIQIFAYYSLGDAYYE